MELSNYNKVIVSRKRNRITAIIIYSFISTIAVVLPIYINDSRIIILTVFVIFGGLAILFYILLSPLRNPLELHNSTDDELVVPQEGSLEYYDEQPMTVVLKIVIPMIIIYSVATVWIYFTETTEAIYFFAALVFFVTIALVFSKVTICISSGNILIKLGPFNDLLKISEIVSMRVVAVKSMGTYFGYGKRVGVDGSIGYITGSKTGVRILMKNGRTYIISHNNPQNLVNVLQYSKKSE